MYITEDVGDIYVDMSNSKRVRLNAEAAEKIRKITYNSDGSYKSEVSFNYNDIFALMEQVAELDARRPTYVLNVELIGETTEDGFDICRANPSEVVEAAAKHMDGYVVYCELDGLRIPLMAVEDDYLAFAIGSGIETLFVYISSDGYGAIENVFGVYDDEYRAFLEEYREQIETLQEADGALAEADAAIRSELENKAPHRAGVYFVKGTGTTAGTWLGTSSDITEYYDGLTVAYEIGIAGGSSTTTLNINNLGAKTCYRYGTSKITTQHPVGTVVLLVYSATKGAWYATDYDANTNTQVRLYKDETGTYPIIGSRTAASDVTSGTTAVYGEISGSKAITMTPSTGTITATIFAGNASTATKATQDASGNVITDTYATKAELNNHITTHAPSNAEKNQNAFSNIKVGDTTIAADSVTDTFTLVAGNNVTLTPDATNDKITITATDTVYTHPSYTARTGKPTSDATPKFGETFTVSQITSDALGHVTAATDRTVKIPNTAATTSAAGLMSAADKTKLDGIAENANNYTHPSHTAKPSGLYKVTVDSLGHVSATAAVAKADITGLGIPAQDTTYSNMTAATSSAAGKAGLVPAPAAGKQDQFLRGDGTWATPTNTTYTNFVKSGSNAAAGLVPAPSTTAGTTKYLCENGTWAVPYTHPTSAGNKHIPSGGASGNILKYSASGTAAWDSITNVLGYTPINSNLKGAANGIAELDASGKVPASQLPSYVDDIIEIDSSEVITDGEAGKIYVNTDNNKTYRWSGSSLVEISASLALGETSSTAYRGDRGKAAYEHSQSAHAPSNAEENQNAFGSIMKSGTTNVSYDATHPTDTIVFGGDNCIKVDISTGTSGTNVSYSIPSATTNARGAVQIGSNINVSNGVISVPAASGSAAGVTIVYPAASCTTFSSDSGTITPLAAQKAAKMFAITRPTSVANTIPRFTNATGDVESTGIKIESVTNSRDNSKKAHVLSIPAEGGKKMVYGYCTDQVDGTSFIGGVFDANVTEFPYNAGLAIGGTSGNLLWKGAKVVTTDDLASYATTSSLSSYLHKTSTTAQTIASAVTFNSTAASSSKTTGAVIVKGGLGVSGSIYGNKVYGAVWNDYAEYREGTEEFEAGRVVCENGDDTLSLATERLQPGANIVSDTFGFAIGETDAAKTPLAVSGRVLAYTYEDRETYKPGDAVCAAPNGTVSKMTREEIREYPERIIGTVSAIPSYEVWGENNIPVNGRIWIKVK